jgi:dolichyl-phosphate beta-glucosyltransferase
MLEEAVEYLREKDESLNGETVSQNGSAQKKTPNGKKKHANGNSGRSSSSSPSSLLPRWEILIVNDGSTDNTVATALHFSKTRNLPPSTLRVITLHENRGKGGAVTHGMRHVRGQYAVFADADGASKFEDLGKLITNCQHVEDSRKRGVAVGSRAHLVGSEAVVKV